MRRQHYRDVAAGLIFGKGRRGASPPTSPSLRDGLSRATKRLWLFIPQYQTGDRGAHR
jgi:hypothetical protein